MRQLFAEINETELIMCANNCDKITCSQVRKIRPTRRSVSGSYAFRGKTSIQYESTLERDFLIRHEFFLDVAEIIPQPVEIPFVASNGRQFTYTPDFLVSIRSSSPPMLVEVKPTNEWQQNWRIWSSKWKAARRYAKQRGWIFRISDEARIRDKTLENIKFLERYKRSSCDQHQSKSLLMTLQEKGPLCLKELLSIHNLTSEHVALIRHLIAVRLVDCDISKPLDDFILLWIPNHE